MFEEHWLSSERMGWHYIFIAQRLPHGRDERALSGSGCAEHGGVWKPRYEGR